DVTAHVLEGLGLLDAGRTDHAIAKALDYIRQEQESEGSWFGRWGVNHIYGTAAVLPALKVLGEDMDADYVIRAARWLVSCQNTDGGWGESPMSYMDDSLRGEGETTASQTAWAIMALIAVNGDDYASHIQRGVDYLVENQIDGTWHEEKYTGTGFPGYGAGARADLARLKVQLQQGNELSRGFMINYNMYRHYFPLMALGRARRYLSNTE
ncbi:MAG: squalene--hopene cyclase, partial [Gammaproteobacteria bacterium]|nr:squalene--hopene cyclase [Gammaproteobacteria bacterium]